MRFLLALIGHLSPFRFPQPAEEERLRELERRVQALDATIGAQQTRRARERRKREEDDRRGDR